MNKLIVVALVVGLAVGLAGGLLLNRPANLGGAGARFAQPQFFLSGAYSAGEKDLDASVKSVTGTSVATLTAAQVCENPVISVAFITSTGTVTFPSAANFIAAQSCLSDPGDARRFAILNASSTGQFQFTAGASSSITVLNVSSTGVAAATSSITARGLGEFDGYRVTSSSAPWIVWTVKVAP